MIIKYGGSNFFSFKESVEVSFELNGNCPDKLSQGKRTSPLMCVKGANGAGKTNALKMLSFLGFFCSNSYDLKPDEGTSVDSFFDNDEATELYIDIEIKGMVYSYDIMLTAKEVLFESLHVKDRRKTLIFKREGNKLTDYQKTKFSKKTKVFQDDLRNNASFVSQSHQWEEPILLPFYEAMNNIDSNVGRHGWLSGMLDVKGVAGLLYKCPEFLKYTKEALASFDTGICDLTVEIEETTDNGELNYAPVFFHKTSTGLRRMRWHNQSNGTRELFLKMALFKHVLDTGGVLCLDEIEVHIHPHIVYKLIDLFASEERNPNGSQLLFTTHLTEVINKMGKYRTLFINKNDSESFGYRLDELPPDLTRIKGKKKLSDSYNACELGGVPRL